MNTAAKVGSAIHPADALAGFQGFSKRGLCFIGMAKCVFAGLLISTAMLAPAVAEDAPDAPVAAVPTFRKVRMVCITQMREMKSPLRIVTSAGSSEISVSKRSLSDAVDLPEDGQLRLFATGEPAPEGQDSKQVLLQVQVPPDVKKPLIVLYPVIATDGGSSGNEIKASVQDLATLTSGDWFFVNVATKDVGIVLDEKKYTVKAGESHIHQNASSPSPVAKMVNYQIFSIPNQGGEWLLQASSQVMMNPGRKEMCIFSNDPHGPQVTYYGITMYDEVDSGETKESGPAESNPGAGS